MPKFQSVNGGHVQIFRQDNPSNPINIDEGGFYETDDKEEIQALKDSPEVMEAAKDESKGDSETRKR